MHNVEYSEIDLITVRIISLESEFKSTIKTINYKKQRLLEIELGKAYRKLMEIQNLKHKNNE